MKFMTKTSHVIDFIFPVALLFVFALSALVVTLFASKVYDGTVESSMRSDTARTSLAYISEKIHACDMDGEVKLSKFDGCDSIILTEEIKGEKYNTYIYFNDGQLNELFAKSDAKFSADNGTRILEVKSFTMGEKSKDIFLFTCIDKKGQSASAVVGIK